jgi:hypothetical protein
MTHENILVKVPLGIWEKQELKGRSHLNPKIPTTLPID